jgi:hypothetical protein
VLLQGLWPGVRTRTFTPSIEFPFRLVLVDELAFLTAYQPERDLRKRGRHRDADQPGPVGLKD